MQGGFNSPFGKEETEMRTNGKQLEKVFGKGKAAGIAANVLERIDESKADRSAELLKALDDELIYAADQKAIARHYRRKFGADVSYSECEAHFIEDLTDAM